MDGGPLTGGGHTQPLAGTQSDQPTGGERLGGEREDHPVIGDDLAGTVLGIERHHRGLHPPSLDRAHAGSVVRPPRFGPRTARSDRSPPGADPGEVSPDLVRHGH
jgi:hypothetical protein